MSTDNITVAIKPRPLLEQEKKADNNLKWVIKDGCIYQEDCQGQKFGEEYYFDHIFDINTTNKNVYDEVVKPHIQLTMKGFNLTIFAYGQTSSGKTYTMTGNSHNPGLMQLSVNDIFEYVQNHPERQFLIRCSYFEIYNEQIYDLLHTNQKIKNELKIREDCSGNLILDATEIVTTGVDAVMSLIKKGNKYRKVGSTKANNRSSRSHALFRIRIESKSIEEEMESVTQSQFHLVDLAGSERIAQTQAQGLRLQEGVNINKSLSALSNVIRQLNENEKFVNYRDSKLTRILQSALGGNAKAVMVTTLTLAASEETKSSLEFSQRAQSVKNKPVMNQLINTNETGKALLKHYEQQLLNLQKEMKMAESAKEDAEKKTQELKYLVQNLTAFYKLPAPPPDKSIRRHTLGAYDLARETNNLHFISTPKHENDAFKPEKLPNDYFTELSERADKSIKLFETNIPTELFETDEDETTRVNHGQPPPFHELPVILEEESSDESSESEDPKNNLEQLYVTPAKTAETHLDISTPASVWKKRAKSFEDSYEQLKEYTRFEHDFVNEEGGFVQRLITEKDSIYEELLSTKAKLLRKSEQVSEQEEYLRKIRTCYENLKNSETDYEIKLPPSTENTVEIRGIVELLNELYAIKFTQYKNINDMKVREFVHKNEALMIENKKLQQMNIELDETIFTMISEQENDKKLEKDVLSASTQTDEQYQELENNKESADVTLFQIIVRELETDLEEHRRKNHILSTMLDAQSDKAIKFEELNSKLEQKTMELLNAELNNTKNLEIISDLNQEIKKLSNELCSLKQERESQKEKEHLNELERNKKNMELISGLEQRIVELQYKEYDYQRDKEIISHLTRQNDKYLKQIQDLKQELESQNETYQQKESELIRKADLTSKLISDSNEHIQELLKDKCALNQEIDFHKAKLHQIELEKIELASNMDQKVKTSQDLEQENHKNTILISDLKLQNDKLQQEICVLNQKIDLQKEKLHQIDLEKTELISEIEKEVMTSQDLVQENKNNIKMISELNLQNDNLRQEICVLNHKIDFQQEKLHQIDLEKTELVSNIEKKVNTSQDLVQENKKYIIMISELNLQNDKLRQELCVLNHKIDFQTAQLNQIELENTKLVINMEKKVKITQDLEQELKKNLIVISDLNLQNYKLQQEICALSEECDLYRREAHNNQLEKAEKVELISTLNKRIDELKYVEDVNVKNNEKISYLTQQNEKLLKDIYSLNQELILQRKKHHRNELERTEKEELIPKLKEKVEELENSEMNCHKIITELRNKNSEMTERIKLYEQKYNNLNDSGSSSEITPQRKSDSDSKTRESIRKKIIYNLHDSKRNLSLSNDADDLDILREDYETLQKELENSLKEAEQERDKWRNKFNVTHDQYCQLQKQLELRGEELVTMRKTIDGLTDIKNEKYMQYVKATTDLCELTESMEIERAMFENKMSVLQNEIAKYKARCNVATGEKSVQTDLTVSEMAKQAEKYLMTKRVANMRAEELQKLKQNRK